MHAFVVTRNLGGDLIPTYIEAKDVGKDLNSKSYRKQFARYKKALDNLIITDYVWFQFFRAGELVYEVRRRRGHRRPWGGRRGRELRPAGAVPDL